MSEQTPTEAKKPLDSLLAELETLYDDFDTAKLNEEDARIVKTQLTNRINGLQKEIDARFDELKKTAPYATDWGTSQYRLR
jgi:hypothetical protein